VGSADAFALGGVGEIRSCANSLMLGADSAECSACRSAYSLRTLCVLCAFFLSLSLATLALASPPAPFESIFHTVAILRRSLTVTQRAASVDRSVAAFALHRTALHCAALRCRDCFARFPPSRSSASSSTVRAAINSHSVEALDGTLE
jgi:hypothetical protein